MLFLCVCFNFNYFEKKFPTLFCISPSCCFSTFKTDPTLYICIPTSLYIALLLHRTSSLPHSLLDPLLGFFFFSPCIFSHRSFSILKSMYFSLFLCLCLSHVLISLFTFASPQDSYLPFLGLSAFASLY